MSVTDKSTIDVAGIDKDGVLVLTISDHLEWDNSHLYVLQEKINAYLAYIESGEVYELYPASRGGKFKICVVCKYKPDASATNFIEQCTKAINQAGFEFSYNVCILIG